MKLQKDEQETHIYQNASNRNEWVIYTDDPTMVRELRKKNLTELKTTSTGVEFKLPSSQLTIRKKRSVNNSYKISAVERKRRSSQMKKLNSENP